MVAFPCGWCQSLKAQRSLPLGIPRLWAVWPYSELFLLRSSSLLVVSIPLDTRNLSHYCNTWLSHGLFYCHPDSELAGCLRELSGKSSWLCGVGQRFYSFALVCIFPRILALNTLNNRWAHPCCFRNQCKLFKSSKSEGIKVFFFFQIILSLSTSTLLFLESSEHIRLQGRATVSRLWRVWERALK